MATSGSIDYNQTRNEIITDALLLLGVVNSNESASANDITFCSGILNKMIKSWQAQGIHLWKETEGTITITADQSSYTLNSTNFPSIGRPIYISDCRYSYSSGLDRKMRKLGRSEYNALPTKTTATGPSTAWYYSPQLSSGILYVWPVPTSSETSDTFSITYLKTIEDFDASSDDPDFPSEWLEALTYNLAVRIAPAFGIVLSKTNPDVLVIAAASLNDLKSWDFEEGSIKIHPNHRY